MRILLAHDHRFRLIDGVFYSPGGLSDEVLGRYTQLAEELVVCARVVSEDASPAGLSRISNPQVGIVAGGWRGTALAELESAVASADAVIARLPGFIGSAALTIARRLHKPALTELVGCPWDAFRNHSALGMVAAPGMFALTRWHVWNSTHVLYVTKEFLQRRYPTRGLQLGCSDVILDPINEEVRRLRMARIDSLKAGGVLRAATIGAVDVPYKKQDLVIRALGELRRHGLTLEYWLIGGGDQRKLRLLARECGVDEQVRFFGSVPHAEVSQLLDNVDVYVQPSLQEGLPRAMLEAMARGCLAIGTPVGGMPELLSPMWLVRPKLEHVVERLKSVDPAALTTAADQSFRTASLYTMAILDEVRTRFYKDFLAEVTAGGSGNRNGL